VKRCHKRRKNLLKIEDIKNEKSRKEIGGAVYLNSGDLLLAPCSRMTDASGATNNQGISSQHSISLKRTQKEKREKGKHGNLRCCAYLDGVDLLLVPRCDRLHREHQLGVIAAGGVEVPRAKPVDKTGLVR
jgi:hypothetical protein